MCTGNNSETEERNCGLPPCTVDGGFTQWGQWANPPCSVTCGSRATKNVSRVRSCSNPIPQNGGIMCTGNNSETEERNCGLPPCTVDGGFTQWGQWANPPCSVTCGSRATKNVSRVRSCSNPIPQNGGTFCTGNNSETEERNCGLPPCTVDGGFTQWGQWANPPCSVTCGSRATKNVSRVRSCSNPIPQNGGTFCTGNSSETEERNCGLPPCTVDGGITPWSTWSHTPCSKTCGRQATRVAVRTRSCTYPDPQTSGDCPESRMETREEGCTLSECPVDGGFTQWGQWANPPCSVTCGSRATKNVSRVRSCSNPIPQNGGTFCTGNNSETEERNCALPPCTDYGVLSTWSDWSEPSCDVTCGMSAGKVATRSRSCSNDNKNCPGHMTETKQSNCRLSPCPGQRHLAQPALMVMCGTPTATLPRPPPRPLPWTTTTSAQGVSTATTSPLEYTPGTIRPPRLTYGTIMKSLRGPRKRRDSVTTASGALVSMCCLFCYDS
ncbi:hemicentin-1-like isoform X1 [Haliotis rufescens]|uniref:hemicentin-1-like isoform X1 n=1 Tax=Haliotis rufescens TaxID=6454 RepID=UPI00201F0B0E|nr:hemicentin-1-like isoform X1 [Haliotis rufescens]